MQEGCKYALFIQASKIKYLYFKTINSFITLIQG